MDGCHRWDVWGHEVGIDNGGGVAAECRINGGANVERGSGAGAAGGRGKHECGWVEVSSSGSVSWQVNGGVVD